MQREVCRKLWGYIKLFQAEILEAELMEEKCLKNEG